VRSIIRPRRDWTRKPVDARCTKQLPKRPVLFVHYSDTPGRALTTKRKQISAIRSIYAFHTGTRGWYDIGYSYLVAQPWGIYPYARLWRGRGKGAVPASQEGHNEGNLSVCVLANGTEPIKDDTVRAIAKLAREVNAKAIRPHSAVNSTDCPGNALRRVLPAIRLKAGL
jgi:hypothetical protein